MEHERQTVVITGFRGVSVTQSLISHAIHLSTSVCLFDIAISILLGLIASDYQSDIINLLLYEQKSLKFWQNILRAPFSTCCLREW